MMKRIALFVFVSAAFALASCSSSKGVALRGEWDIVAVNGTPVDTSKVSEPPYIGFEKEENRVYGCASCNRFFASVKMDTVKLEIHFDNAGVTRMMCPNMETEDAIVKALNKIVRYKPVGNDEVDMYDTNGHSMLLIRKGHQEK